MRLHPSGVLARRRLTHREQVVRALVAISVVSGVGVAVLAGADQPEPAWTLRSGAQAALSFLGAVALGATGWWIDLRRVVDPVGSDPPPRRRASIVAFVALPAHMVVVLLALDVSLPPALAGLWIGVALQLALLTWWETRLRLVERAWAATPFWSGPLPGDPSLARTSVRAAPPVLWPATVSRPPEIAWTDLPAPLEFGAWAVLVTAGSAIALLAREAASAGALLVSAALGVVAALAAWRMDVAQQRILGHRRVVWGLEGNSVLLRRPAYATARWTCFLAVTLAVLSAGGELRGASVLTALAAATFGIGLVLVVGRADAGAPR